MMNFILLDYSGHYFDEVAGTGLPRKREGKFIQVRHHPSATEYLVLSPRGLSAYHANIAERFFSSRGVKGAFNRKRDHYGLSSSEWEIVGGGMWEVDEGAMDVRFFGRSQAYGAFDPEGLGRRLRGLPVYSGYSIAVDGR